jgi:hypothetical protein
LFDSTDPAGLNRNTMIAISGACVAGGWRSFGCKAECESLLDNGFADRTGANHF